MAQPETISARLADFADAVSYKDIPAAVVEKAKLVILDTIGCMIAGSTLDKGRALTEYFSSISANGNATLLGSSKRCTPEMAAFGNGTFAHMLDFDEGHRPSDNHLACVVVPAALAVCETEVRSGVDFLTSVVVGYEVMGRVGRAVVLPRLAQHFHGTGTTGTFGAAVAAGKFILNRSQMANSLGIAGTASAGLTEVLTSGFDSKSLHAGRAAFNGVMAAYLALRGFEGPEKIIEGDHGFCRAVTPGYVFDPILEGLSSSWELAYAGFKKHATCGITFTAVDCMLDIIHRNGLEAKDIASIKIGVPARVVRNEAFTHRIPTSTGQARFSVIYAVVAAALYGRVGLDEISMEKIERPETARMVGLTEMLLDEESEAVDVRDRDNPMFFPPASVDVITRDNRHFRRFRAAPVGYDPIGSPPTPEEVADKFRVLAGRMLSGSEAQAVIDTVAHLEQCEKGLNPLTTELRKSPK